MLHIRVFWGCGGSLAFIRFSKGSVTPRATRLKDSVTQALPQTRPSPGPPAHPAESLSAQDPGLGVGGAGSVPLRTTPMLGEALSSHG